MESASLRCCEPIETSIGSEGVFTPRQRQNSRLESFGVIALAVVAHGAVIVGLAQRGRATGGVSRQVLTVELLKRAPPRPAIPVDRVVASARFYERGDRSIPGSRPRGPAPTRKPAPLIPQSVAAEPESELHEEAVVAASDRASEATSPSPPSPPPAPTPVAPREGAHYLSNPRPAYPDLALRRNWQGEVLLRVHVMPTGRPAEIAIARSSGRSVLDESALRAVRAWSFVPARIGDEEVDGWVNVPIVFHLD